MKGLTQFYPAHEGTDSVSEDKNLSGLSKLLAARITDGSRDSWRYLAACRRVIEEVALEFDGDDPCAPNVRQLPDEAVTEIRELAAGGCPGAVEPFELPEPSEEDIGKIRRLILGHD